LHRKKYYYLNLELTNKKGDSLKIDLSNGASLTHLFLNGEEVIKYPLKENDTTKGYPSAVLFPFPNRIKDGKYSFEEIEYALAQNDLESHNAIHGLVAFETFELVSKTNTKAICKYVYEGHIVGYPFPYELVLTYELKNSALAFQIEVTNTGDGNMPYGFGWHPYFGFSGESISEMSLKVARRKKIEIDERFIPTSEFEIERAGIIQLKNTILDNIFAVENEGTLSETVLRWKKKKLTVSQKTGKGKLNYFVLYTPSSRNCIAIEPQTCSTNAFNSGDGLLILKKGKKASFEISVSVEG
jgi:aldose 1-epimerase